MKEKISLERLKEIIDYDPEVGKLIWKISKASYAGKVKPGVEAGYFFKVNASKTLYRAVYIDGIKYFAHRLAWFYMTGEWPEKEIDHIDGNGLNNKFANLRKANHSQNNCNVNRIIKTQSGLKGAYYNKRTNQWFSQISVSGKMKYLGTFSNKELCAEAYQKACIEINGEFGKPTYE